MRKPLTTFLACLALLPAAAFTACGGDDNDSSDTADQPAVETEGRQTTPEQEQVGTEGDTVKVDMVDIKFKPETVTVKVGQTIEWVNKDAVPHTATAENGADFDSGQKNKGETYQYTAEQDGEIDYDCTIHPTQKGKIIVES